MRQRDSKRSQRLTAAASTASTLQLQSQHVRDVAAAATAAAAGAAAEELQAASIANLLQDQQQSTRRHSLSTAREQKQDSGTQEGPATRRQLEPAAGSCRVSHAAVKGEVAMRQLLPSTGAAAAAAIAACGEIDPASLPSRVARAEVSGMDGRGCKCCGCTFVTAMHACVLAANQG